MLFVIFLLLFSGFTYSQDSGTPAVELFFYTVNVQGSPIMNFQLTAQSSVWGREAPSTYFITHDYDEVVYTPDYNNMPPQQAEGINFITSTGGANQLVFAYGLYKVTSNRTGKYFFLDYRDDRIGFYSLFQPPTYGHDIDLWIKYVYPSDKFYYSSFSATTNFVEIQNAQVLNLWEIKQKGNPSTDQFPNFWQNCLSVVNDGNNFPKLVWRAYPNPDVEVLSYKIYRSVTNNITPPPPPNFVYLTSKESNIFSFVDDDFAIGGPIVLRYKVTAVVRDFSENEYETSPTNIVQIKGGFYKESNNGVDEISSPVLSNYPNPFNPTTTIKYQLAESGNVRLVVTNSLGEEVNVLEEGLKEAGEYSVEFNSENLPSGIYICSLITNRGITSNKMFLLR